MIKLFKMPMRLQFFAEDLGGGGAGTGTPETPADPKTFTQEEMDQVVADRVGRETKKATKAQSVLQTQLDEATTKLNSAGKTNEEQGNVELEALKGNLSTAQGELANTKAELEALKQGADVEQINKVIKLAKLSDEDDIEDAIKSILEEYPMFKKGKEKENNPNFSKNGNPSKNSGEITKESFAKMGYKERLELRKANPKLYDQLK